MRNRLLFSVVTFVFVVLGASACPADSSTSEPETTTEPEAGSEPEADPAPDAGTPTDGGAPADAGFLDAGGEPPLTDAGPAGLACTFNPDCRPDERCECSELDGCFCAFGERGDGVVGVDPCTDGNDCASSLCLEGPNDALVCSGPCTTEADCGGAVPLCADVAFVGRICIREPE